MNLLDENFPEDQLPLLKQWRIPARRVGTDVARLGAKDADIIPALHRVGRVTFFTQDEDFFHRALCHPAYCLVWLDVRADDAAWYLRRLLKHERFNTVAKRMGLVARAHHDGIQYWRQTGDTLRSVVWPVD